MTRLEIIGNQSLQDEIISLLEEHIPGVLYTIIPVVTGKGKNNYKLGNSTWPETNFVLISYVEDSQVETAKKIIAAVKEKFEGEGLKLFCVKAEE